MIRATVEINSRRIAEILIANVGGDDSVADYAWSAHEAPGPQGCPGIYRGGVLHGHDRRQPALMLVSRVLDKALSAEGTDAEDTDAATAAALASAHCDLVAALPLTPGQALRWAMLEAAEDGR